MVLAVAYCTKATHGDKNFGLVESLAASEANTIITLVPKVGCC